MERPEPTGSAEVSLQKMPPNPRDRRRGRSLLRRRRTVVAAAVVWLLAAATTGALPARGDEAAGRPKVGLALSGGGAKGGAHVGVLQVLEELRVPVDYVAGTSMGAVAGGLYAAGLSPGEIARVFLETDWDEALRDQPPREALSFRRKDDDRRYLFDLELGLKGGRILLPGGWRSGRKLTFMLRRLTLPARAVRDFDRLPVPFRAIATDIESGEMVVLGEGDLAEVIRASMAIPGVFSPVELEGRLLVDGGVTNNVPVDVVRQMGADVVIAVDIGDPLAGRDELRSLVAISGQTVGLLTRKNMEPRLADADLVLRPPVAGYTFLQFSAATEILAAGVEAAREAAPALSQWAVPAGEHRRLLAHQRQGDVAPPVIDVTRIEGTRRVDDRIVVDRLRVRPGQRLDFAAVAQDLDRLYGLGDFETIDVHLEEIENQTALVLAPREKPWGPNYLHFGLLMEGDLEGESRFGLLANLTLTRLNALGAEWRNDLQVGRTRRLFTELYQPLDFGGRFFVAAQAEITRERSGLYAGDRKIAELDVDRQNVGVDLGRQFGRWAELRLGIRRGRADTSVETGGGVSPPDDVDFGAWVAQIALDTVDNAGVPNQGTGALIVAFLAREELGSEQDYEKLAASASHFTTFGRHTVFGGLELGWSSDGELPAFDQFTLGGFLSLSGLSENQLRGAYLGVARAGYYRRVGRLPAGLGEGVYAGGWLEGGNVWKERDEVSTGDLIGTLTLALGADTGAGPLYVAYGRTEDGDDRFYLSLGKLF